MDQSILKYIPALFSAALVACGGGNSDSPATLGAGGNSTANAPLSSSEGSNTGADPSTSTPSGFDYDESARFNGPSWLTADLAGNLFVLDAVNKIRKIAASGEVTTLAATLTAPRSLELDDFDGTLLTLEGNAVRKVAPGGAVTTLATLPEGARAITIDAGRYVQALVTDSSHDTAAIFRVSPEGAVSMTYSGAPLDAGNSQAITAAPLGSTLYVGQRGGTIYQFPLGETGTEFVTVAGGEVLDLAFDAAGNLYISEALYSYPSVGTCADTGNCDPRLVYAGIYKRASDGSITTLIQTSQLGVARIAVGPDGNLYAAFSDAHAIYKVGTGGVLTLVAGKPGEAGMSD